MDNLRRIKSRYVSIRSASNSSIKAHHPNPQDNQILQSDYHISEHEAEYISLNQLELQENKLGKKL